MKKIIFLLLISLCFLYAHHDTALRAESNTARGMLYVIGAGCGDPDLLTLRAVSYIKKCDYIVCVGGLEKTISHYIGNKPVLFDPLLQVPFFYKKRYPQKMMKECKIETEALYGLFYHQQNLIALRSLDDIVIDHISQFIDKPAFIHG